MKKPSFWGRMVFTITLSIVFYGAMQFYHAVMYSEEAKIAVGQVKDSIVEYSFSQAFIHSDLGGIIPWIVFLAVLWVIWGKFIGYYLCGSDEDSRRKKQ